MQTTQSARRRGVGRAMLIQYYCERARKRHVAAQPRDGVRGNIFDLRVRSMRAVASWSAGHSGTMEGSEQRLHDAGPASFLTRQTLFTPERSCSNCRTTRFGVVLHFKRARTTTKE